MTTETESQVIRQARKNFAAMVGAFSFGVFNDNFYKQAVMVLAVEAGRTSMQGHALVVFTLPFLLLAAPAGWLADRFAKRQVIIGCKWMELIAMLLGATGIIFGNWPLIFGMLAVMGSQATLFSPALNGSIPELYPPSHILHANAFMRMASMAAIMLGVALAGIVLDRPGELFGIEKGRWYVGLGVVGVALIGLAVSYGAPHKPPACVGRSFPWAGPWQTLLSLREIGRDRLLTTALAANMFIWFTGSIQILVINPLGIEQLHLSKTVTSLLLVTQLVGIGVGGLISSKLVVPERWHRVLPPAGIGLGAVLIAMAAVPLLPPKLILPAVFAGVAATGVFGGLFLIPVESFLQIRADPTKKGEVWATANFAVLGGILLSGPLSNLMNAWLPPTVSLGYIGVFTYGISAALWFVFRRLE